MIFKDLLETVLFSQKITLKKLFDLDGCEDRYLLDKVPQDQIPYTRIAEFLDSEVQTIEAAVDEWGQPYLYIEI